MKKIKPLAEENEKLENEVERLNNKNEALKSNSKRKNVLKHGILESIEEKQDDLTALITTTLSAIDMRIEKSEIDRALRLGKKTNRDGKIRPILFAITTLHKNIQVLKNKKKN
ncbi:hypothetical protein EVAR_36488_1 [Eumeta japonica]|uniref:Uncharacterized protein n=1 Tax=Eumeta variegata TaxID=151549 RepID=A0A4C1WUH2_EUMVA|nr:hypothetical protein EVAR_36488_1 [Eumeta japonica]